MDMKQVVTILALGLVVPVLGGDRVIEGGDRRGGVPLPIAKDLAEFDSGNLLNKIAGYFTSSTGTLDAKKTILFAKECEPVIKSSGGALVISDLEPLATPWNQYPSKLCLLQDVIRISRNVRDSNITEDHYKKIIINLPLSIRQKALEGIFFTCCTIERQQINKNAMLEIMLQHLKEGFFKGAVAGGLAACVCIGTVRGAYGAPSTPSIRDISFATLVMATGCGIGNGIKSVILNRHTIIEKSKLVTYEVKSLLAKEA
jgi:hypothetical protein